MATIELWLQMVGWMAVSGAGTTDIIFRSTGEDGTKTMLYVHFWKNGNQMRAEVCDDDVPTHQTNEGSFVDSGGVQFTYHVSADKDAISLAWSLGAGWRFNYVGLLMPFALEPPDETFYSISAANIQDASILRRHDGLWDRDDTLYHATYQSLLLGPDRDDGSVSLWGTYFGDNADIAGQLKHVSGRVYTAFPPDTIETRTATWILVRDNVGRPLAMRTGGTLELGCDDGQFAHVSGVVNTVAEWYAAVAVLMAGVGWTVTDISAASGNPFDIECYSTGETATDVLWIRIFHAAGATGLEVSDLAFGTVGRHVSQVGFFNESWLPADYWATADKDCLACVMQADEGFWPVWVGKTLPFARTLSDESNMSMVAGAFNLAMRVLRDHTGAWNQAAYAYHDGLQTDNSNFNNYDNRTFLVWPFVVLSTWGVWREAIGQLKYIMHTDGGGVSSMDTISVGSREHTVFWTQMGGGDIYALRTA